MFVGFEHYAYEKTVSEETPVSGEATHLSIQSYSALLGYTIQNHKHTVRFGLGTSYLYNNIVTYTYYQWAEGYGDVLSNKIRPLLFSTYTYNFYQNFFSWHQCKVFTNVDKFC